MLPETYKYLYDIAQACCALETFIHNKTLDEYQNDLFLRSAVERQFGIIGEALNQASKIDESLEKNIVNVREIINLRNVIIHSYSTVENETIWGILQNDLPKLHQQVKTLLADK